MLRSLVALACLPGCFVVVSEERTRTVKTSERWNAPTPMTAPVPEVAAVARDGGLDVIAVWRRQCSWTGDKVIDQRIETGATVEFWGGGDSCTGECGILYIFSILAAPVTLGISGIVTGIKVARTDDRFVTKVQPLPLRHGTCDAPAANAQLVVLSPQAEPKLVTTDARGRVRVEGSVDATVRFVPPDQSR